MFGIMFVDLGSPLIVAFLIDHVVGKGRYDLLAPLMVIFLMLPLAAAVFRMISGYIVTLLGQRVIFDIRLDLYRHVNRLHCRYLQNTTTGKLMERIRGDVQQLQTLLTTQAPQLIVQLVTGLIMVLVMLALSVKLTAVVLIGMTLYVANYKWMVPKIRRLQRRFRRKMDSVSGLAQERLTGAIVVKTFGRERKECRSFLHRTFSTERVYHRFLMFSLNYSLLSSLVTWGTYSILLLLGTWLAIRGEITYGTVTAVTAFAFRLLLPASMLAELSNQLQQGKVALDRIFELMNADCDVISNSAGEKLHPIGGDVQFKNVSFQYEDDKPVLQNLNLSVLKGQTVALVGQTGCGKSTIINLLYRYFDVNSGEILVDGKNIQSLNARTYRKQLAMVPQEPIILDGTMAENIAYGDSKATREQIEQAARMVELGELLDGFDKGLDTALGDDGAKLSVGEKQRLCIARAIVAQPAILMLDEATSSLDTHSEAMIQLAMRRVMKNRTCFVVAHRLSTIVSADLIVVLDSGRVLEMGNHLQLMAKPNGRYRDLYLTQTANQQVRRMG